MPIILEVRSIVTMESVERSGCHSVHGNGLAVSEGTTVQKKLAKAISPATLGHDRRREIVQALSEAPN